MKALIIFFLSRIVYGFKLKNLSAVLYYCGENLSKVSYRIPRKEKQDFLATFRIYKRILLEIFAPQNDVPFIQNQLENPIAIFDGDLSYAKLRADYVESFDETAPSLIIGRNQLFRNCDTKLKLIFLIFLSITVFPVFIISIFSKNKASAAFGIREYFESILLLRLLKKFSVKKLHFFCIFERDANILSYLLMDAGIIVNKIPSEVPLVFFNQTIVTSTLSFCFAYQKEEYDNFKKTMFVRSTQNWAPELYLLSPERFRDKRNELINQTKTIGFYSSANWLREKLGDVDLGHNDRENEELLLDALIKICNKRNLALEIYLHPLEKKEKHTANVKSYYEAIINQGNVSIGSLFKASIESFDQVNLAVSLYSTLMFERIFFGFKTILAPWGYPEFPIKGCPFNNICAKDIPDLEKKILHNLPLSRQDFFDKNNIKHYTNYLNF